jgi:hypothetical protein
MSAMLRQRTRIVRVRRIQHGLAASAAAQASGQVELLESSAEQLARLRDGIGADGGITTGNALATRGELAMRLDSARAGMQAPIARARSVSAAQEKVRLAARRDQESAEKLQQRAASAAARLAERRAPAPRRRRPRFADEGDRS